MLLQFRIWTRGKNQAINQVYEHHFFMYSKNEYEENFDHCLQITLEIEYLFYCFQA
jgi:hypothetical protein